MNHVVHTLTFAASAFLTGNQKSLLYQEIQISISFWYISSNCFTFFWDLKDCFDKHGHSFNDVSKAKVKDQTSKTSKDLVNEKDGIKCTSLIK